MHQKVQLFPKLALRFVVEHEPMEDVFEERPTQYAGKCDEDDFIPCQQLSRAIEHPHHHWCVHDHRRRRVNVREILEDRVFEEPNGLVLVRNVERHRTYPSGGTSSHRKITQLSRAVPPRVQKSSSPLQYEELMACKTPTLPPDAPALLMTTDC